MAHIPVNKGLLLICLSRTEEIKGKSPTVRVFVIRKIFLSHNDICHEISVDKVLFMAPDDLINGCREQ
jgi:hypothetical protein